MLFKRLHLLLWCAAVSLMAFTVLDFWANRNAPLYKKFEKQWANDIFLLEQSKKLPKAWFDLKEVEIFGGTPDTRGWLKRIASPNFATKDDGRYKLEVLVVAWEENGVIGALTQYNLVDLTNSNMIWELGRTLILSRPKSSNTLENLWESFL